MQVRVWRHTLTEIAIVPNFDSQLRQIIRNLTSVDSVKSLYLTIHRRNINTEKAKQITASVRQHLEYHKAHENAATSVSPLLLFYSIASLARAVTLLFSRNALGEAGLNSGHGLKQRGWRDQLITQDSRQHSNSIKNIPSLEIETERGLFLDFVTSTANYMPLKQYFYAENTYHYDISEIGYMPIRAGSKFSFSEVVSRTPDFNLDIFIGGHDRNFYGIQEISDDKDGNLRVRICDDESPSFSENYEANGYNLDKSLTFRLSCNKDARLNYAPQLTISHTHEEQQQFPTLYIAAPYGNGMRMNALSSLYILSFFTGMLCRYFPTQWMSLIQSDAGDQYLPILTLSQDILKHSFPNNVAYLILRICTDPDSWHTHAKLFDEALAAA